MAKEGQSVAMNTQAHRQMLEHLQGTRHPERDIAIYLLTYRAGMRIGSVAGLTMDDVVDARGELKQVVVLRRKITKGGKTITAYINHPELQAALRAWLQTPENKRFAPLYSSHTGSPRI